jgi:Na+/H+ antiporter NhaC
VNENLLSLIRRLSCLHAPLGQWAPLAGSGLLAGAHFFHFGLVRFLAYSGSVVFGILIASDIARSFIDTHSFPDRSGHLHNLSLPMLSVRIVLSVALGSLYSFLVFAGIGLWMPFIFLPAIFLVCCFVAWRNISLWYEQGEEFEDALVEAQQERNVVPPNIYEPRVR